MDERPVSQVKRLKDKVAELEALLQRDAVDFDGGGWGGPDNDDRLPSPRSGEASDRAVDNSSNLPIPGDDTLNRAPLPELEPGTDRGAGYGFSQSDLEPVHQVGRPADHGSGSAVDLNAFNVEEVFDYSVLNPGFKAFVDQLQGTMDGSIAPDAPQTSVSDPFTIQGESDNYVPTGLTPFLSNTSPFDLEQDLLTSFGPVSATFPSEPQSLVPAPSLSAELLPSSVDVQTSSSSTGSLPRSAPQGSGPASTLEDDPGLTIVGGWFDAADVPKLARDHLLEVFFSSLHMLRQSFCIPRFYAR